MHCHEHAVDKRNTAYLLIQGRERKWRILPERKSGGGVLPSEKMENSVRPGRHGTTPINDVRFMRDGIFVDIFPFAGGSVSPQHETDTRNTSRVPVRRIGFHIDRVGGCVSGQTRHGIVCGIGIRCPMRGTTDGRGGRSPTDEGVVKRMSESRIFLGVNWLWTS